MIWIWLIVVWWVAGIPIMVWLQRDQGFTWRDLFYSSAFGFVGPVALIFVALAAVWSRSFWDVPIVRVRCWLRGYHRDTPEIGRFRYDVDGICCDCGKVGTGHYSDGE